MMSSTARNFDEVFEQELLEIRKRRKACRSHAEIDSDHRNSAIDNEQTDALITENLAGLALSGGGVRSAAFNLGLLQAFCGKNDQTKKCRMESIDYLSTVSGGGYSGVLFSSTVSNDKDGVGFDQLPIVPRADGSQPPRICELSLHGRVMSRPLHWLSRHLWGWMLTIVFVISGIVAIASVLAWLMRIVWSPENLRSVASQGFATDLHVVFYPSFLALLCWAFCNLATAVLSRLGVRVPPISRYAYLLLATTLVLGLVSLLALGDFNMADYVSADLVPASVADVVTNTVHNIAKLALGLLSLCLLPLLTPHKLLESGRNRERPLYRFAFNVAGFAMICGVPLAVFYLLARENVSGYNLQRPHSDMLTPNHLSQLEQFIPRLAAEKAADREESSNLRQHVADELNKAIESSGEAESYPVLRKQIVAEQVAASIPVRLMQYVAYRLVGYERFGELVQRREKENKTKDMISSYISIDVLTNPYLFEPELLNDHSRQADDAERESVQQMLEELRIPRTVLSQDYPSLFRFQFQPPAGWFWRVGLKNDLEEHLPIPDAAEQSAFSFTQLEKGLHQFLSKLASRGRASNTLNEDSARDKRLKSSVLDTETMRLVLIASAMDDIPYNKVSDMTNPTGSASSSGNEKQDEVERNSIVGPGVLLARRLTAIQRLLEMDAVSFAEKLDDKLEVAFGEHRKNPEFLEELERLREAEHQKVASQVKLIRTNNWAILSALYPDYIKPQRTVYAVNVNAADQSFRLRIAGYSTLVFLIVGLLANLNNMCLHSVYRDELAAVWLPAGPSLLKDLDTCRNGGPFHLFNATLNRHGKTIDPVAEDMSLFVLSNRFCGSRGFGFRETREYENGEVGLADTVAISGAAISTSYAGDLLFKSLLFLTNFRLGQWVRNPKHFNEDHYWPSPLRILISRLWLPTDRTYVDLTDGGHLDNTGLLSLLERRCRVMIVGDCSNDPEYQFHDLFCVLRTARARYGIQVEAIRSGDSASINANPHTIEALSHLVPDASCRFESCVHFAVLTLKYPKEGHRHSSPPGDSHDQTAVVIVIKPTVTGDEPVDLLARRSLNDGFPNDSTVNQFLDPDQFESYVMLGRHIGQKLDQFILDGGLDRYELPSPWHSSIQNSGTTQISCSQNISAQAALPEAEQDRKIPSNEATSQAADLIIPAAEPTTSDNVVQPSASSQLPDSGTVGQLLNPLRFDKPGIRVAIALVRQWAEAEFENDQSRLSAESEFFDNIIRQVSQWAREEGKNAPLPLRNLFGTQLQQILNKHTWIWNEADETFQNEFRDMLDWLGETADTDATRFQRGTTR